MSTRETTVICCDYCGNQATEEQATGEGWFHLTIRRMPRAASVERDMCPLCAEDNLGSMIESLRPSAATAPPPPQNDLPIPSHFRTEYNPACPYTDRFKCALQHYKGQCPVADNRMVPEKVGLCPYSYTEDDSEKVTCINCGGTEWKETDESLNSKRPYTCANCGYMPNHMQPVKDDEKTVECQQLFVARRDEHISSDELEIRVSRVMDKVDRMIDKCDGALKHVTSNSGTEWDSVKVLLNFLKHKRKGFSYDAPQEILGRRIKEIAEAMHTCFGDAQPAPGSFKDTVVSIWMEQPGE